MENLIQINQLKKIYKGITVLSIPELKIPQGQTFGLVGNNGAGKTTMFSLLLDLIKSAEGNVEIKGVDVSQDETWKNWVSAFVDDSFLIGFLTPIEYFHYLGSLRNWDKARINDFLTQFEDLFNGEILGVEKYIRDLSKGNQKKVGIVGAMIGEPEIIILDEPFANLDPTTQFKLKELIKKMSQDEKVTFLISSHDLIHTTEVCDRIVALRKGEIAMDVKTNVETLKKLEEFFRA